MDYGSFIVVCITVIFMLVFSILTLLEELKFKRNGRIILGTIVKLEDESEHSGKRPTIEYRDEITKSTHRHRSDGATVQFKKVGDNMKVRVITKGNKRRHELPFNLHVSSFFSFLFCVLGCWFIVSVLNPNNSLNLEDGYDFTMLIVGIPFMLLSFLIYLNQKVKITESDLEETF